MMSTVSTLDSPLDNPMSPRRYRWLRRIAATYFVLALAMGSIVLFWNWQANASYRALKEEWRAAGGPTTPEEANAMGGPFDQRSLDDGTAIVAAIKATQRVRSQFNDPAVRFDQESDRRLPLAGEQVELVRTFLLPHTLTLTEVRQRLDGRRIDFGVRYRSPLISVVLPHLSDVFKFSTRMNDLARLQHADGQDAAALETIKQLFTLSRHIRRPPGVAITFNTARNIDERACAAIEAIAGTLTVGAAPAADRAAVRRLIADLLDDRGWRDDLRRAILVERIMMSDTIENSPATNPWMWPALRLGYRKCDDRWMRPALIAAAAEDRTQADAAGWPVVEVGPSARGQPAPPTPARLWTAARIVADYLMPGFPRSVREAFTNATQRHACGALLAIRLFELDHGRAPAELDELVPDYLPELPRDLTRTGTPPLNYVNADGVIAFWVPEEKSAPASAMMPLDIVADRARRGDLIVIYRGHERMKRSS